ncbi:YciI family protein [Dyella sedimenti]|uniref:YciI family protein n=1 Tax=Dyella sedimenti TaxID=2919947 RepID=UPI001FAAFABB|nr:YciI family protein [Dyella sedimenti]
MWFAITAVDVPDSLEKRMATRPAHLERLQKLQDEGRLLVAGAFPAIESEDPGPAGFTGSLILAQFPSQADAEAWAKADPFVAAGVYASVTVKPFRKAVLAG